MDSVIEIAQVIKQAGGRALVVGGAVRDRLMNQDSKDYDIEVYNLTLKQLTDVLSTKGTVQTIGRAFGVLRLKGLDIDFSLPRRDNKTGPGHRGFEVKLDPGLSFEQASRRRDLTINSMGWDPLTNEILDPHGGQADLHAKRLHATDSTQFCEDPLRGLRVAQFAARFQFSPSPQLIQLCSKLDLRQLPGERLLEEYRKLLLKGAAPSMGLAFLKQSNQLRFFPELQALANATSSGFQQSPNRWKQTLRSLDDATTLRGDGPFENEILMFGLLCASFEPISFNKNSVLTPLPLDLAPSERFLNRLRVSKDLTKAIKCILTYQHAPIIYPGQRATDADYRKLARQAQKAGASLKLLARFTRALRSLHETSAIDAFMGRCIELKIAEHASEDVVLGRHLVAAGLSPGPEFGEILARCREIHDETGSNAPEAILQQALDERGKIA